MDVSVIVSWFIDVSTHNALGSICNDTTTRHLSFYMWVSCAKKKKVLLLMNNSKRCRMKSAFVHHRSFQRNTGYPFR